MMHNITAPPLCQKSEMAKPALYDNVRATMVKLGCKLNEADVAQLDCTEVPRPYCKSAGHKMRLYRLADMREFPHCRKAI